MTSEFQGRLFPKEAADSIGIAPATLRKYSQIVEEVVDNPNFFTRTEQKIRTYSSLNIELLKVISKESNETKKPVKTIVEKLTTDKPEYFNQSEETVVSNDDTKVEETVEKSNSTNISTQNSVQEFLNIINQQNQKIDQLMQMVTALTTEIQDVKPIIQESQHLLEEQVEIKEKQNAVTENNEDSNNNESTEKDNNNIEDKAKDTDKVQENEPEEKIGFFKRLFGSKK